MKKPSNGSPELKFEYQNTGFVGFLKEYWASLIGMFICGLLVAAMVYLMATVKDGTALSNALMTFILTAASCIISYIISKIFAEQNYNREMRDHGVQIARGLMELKKQIGDLTNWAGTKRTVFAQSKTSEVLFDASFEHVELTLQNFVGLADNAVGGIAGVIGAAYIQYEDFIGEVARIRSEGQFKASEIEKEMKDAPANELQRLQQQIDSIASQTEQKISLLAKSASLPVPPAPVKRVFTTPCPECSAVNSVEMIDRPGETKPVSCHNCGAIFNAHVSATRQIFTRAIRSPQIEARPSSNELVKKDHWTNESDVRPEVVEILRRTSAYIDPIHISSVVGLAIKHDQMLRQANNPISAHLLMVSMLNDLGRSESIPNTAIRIFVKMVSLGGGFEFSDPSSSKFGAPYKNQLTEQTLLKAFTNASISRLSALRPVSVNKSSDLTVAIFGRSDANLQSMVEEIVGRINADKQNTT